MNLLAIVGSPRKKGASDALVDKAIEGFLSKQPASNVKKINLIDHTINYCSNCLVCRDSNTLEPIAKCTIRDDMDWIYPEILKADCLLIGSPVHMGYPTGILMTFMERICWVFAKPTKKVMTIAGCPTPRSLKKRRLAIIVVSGIVPPLYRKFCDDVTKLIKQTCHDSLNAKMASNLYAGDIEHRGVEFYFDKAFQVGVGIP